MAHAQMLSIVLLLAAPLVLAEQKDKKEEIKIVPFAEEDLVLGGSLHKECKGANEDDWMVYWRRPDDMMVEGPRISREKLKLSDAGTYECIAIHRYTGRKVERWFNLDFPERWEILEIRTLPGEKFAYNGNIRRDCFPGFFGWTTHWLLPDGTRTPGRYLDIPQASARYRGRYTCVARNFGTGRTMVGWITFNFLRKAKAVLEVMTMPENKVQLGGTLALRCRISSPDWIVHWVKADGIREYRKILRVPDLKLENLGSYWCIGRNRYTGQEVKLLYKLG